MAPLSGRYNLADGSMLVSPGLARPGRLLLIGCFAVLRVEGQGATRRSAAMRRGLCAQRIPRGSGGRSPRWDRGQRGSRGAAAPAPQAPAGRGPAGANEGRGDPQPRPERRKGAADDPAARGRGLHKTPVLLATAGETRPAAPREAARTGETRRATVRAGAAR